MVKLYSYFYKKKKSYWNAFWWTGQERSHVMKLRRDRERGKEGMNIL